MESPFEKMFRLIDIARHIDRDKSTIIRWEEQGLIPEAKRDSRGWRYYSEDQAEKIISLVKSTDYFRRTPDGKIRQPKMVFIGVAIGIVFALWQLFTLGYTHVQAVTNSTSTLFTTITAGALDVVSASSSNSFSGVSVSFSSQSSTLPDLGAINLQDARGSGAGWTLNLSCNDWKVAATGANTLDCNDAGTDNNRGKMCLIVASGAISSTAGQDTTNVTKGGLDCFSAGTSSIDVYTAASSFGKGNYWITDFSMQQYIPSNPTAESITTTIILTLT